MKKLLCLFFALIAVSAPARTISWRSGIGDTLIDSSGLSLDDSFTFELGAFDAGFHAGRDELRRLEQPLACFWAGDL